MYYPLVTKSFQFKDQDIDKNKVITALNSCYENTSFSTFPYLYDNYNSQEAIDNTNSGNCIGLCLFIKNFLKERYGVNSKVIPASIPNMYKKEGYLPISHVALAIPINKNQAYIADPAFYFSEPILFDKTGCAGNVDSSNIYDDALDELEYKGQFDDHAVSLHEKQKLPKNTHRCECLKKTNPDDKWSYYLREAVDPDKSIGTFYINLQKPFISTTRLDKNNQCRMGTYVKLDGDRLIIKKNNKTYFEGNKNEIPRKVLLELNKTLYPFFKEDIGSILKKPLVGGHYISSRGSKSGGAR